jgi:hypothetical protein
LHSVDAGEDEPVVGGECAESAVKGSKVFRGTDLQDGNLDWIGSEGAETFGELADLMRGSGDEDAAVG